MSSYQDKPWLGLYQPGQPSDITPGYGSALALWEAGAAAPEWAGAIVSRCSCRTCPSS